MLALLVGLAVIAGEKIYKDAILVVVLWGDADFPGRAFEVMDAEDGVIAPLVLHG